VQPFGPRDLKKVKFYKFIQQGLTVGNGNVPKHFIYIDDLVHAFEMAVQKENIEGEVFIIGGKPVVYLSEMIEWAAAELQVKSPRKIPVSPMKLLTAAVEAACKPLKIKPPLYKSRLEFYTKGYFFNTDKAERILGFCPTVHIREGISSTVAWYKENNLL
jgi:nucleoside-diphosphate-sugar epimerase